MSTATVEDLPELGKKMRKRREQLGMTATEVARKSGIPLATISNLEDGRYLPSLPKYRSLCRVLRISPGKLLEK